MQGKTKYRKVMAATAIGVALGGVAFGGATLSASAQSRPAGPARVSGSVDVRLTYQPDRDVRTFAFDATARPWSRPVPGAPTGLPTDATGTVRVSHVLADAPGGPQTVRFAARVDCLATTPDGAALTAVVYEADSDVAWRIGQRLGFSVHDADGRREADRVGFSWAVVNGDQNEAGEWGPGRAGTCMAPAAFAPATRGDVTVRHTDLPPDPSTK